MLHLYTFGGLRIERDGQPLQLPTPKARDLLAYLITFRDRPHPRPAMAGRDAERAALLGRLEAAAAGRRGVVLLEGEAGIGKSRLARADAPAHRRPTPDETATLIWTVDAGEEDAALAGREGKVALRRHRLLRLLAEAEAAGARPTVADLAGGLHVSPRTIRADLAALRRQGHAARIRGQAGERAPP